MVATKKRDRQPLVLPHPDERSPEELIVHGKTAFADGDYRTAIRDWRRSRSLLTARGESVTRLDAALAEAYFRRGVTTRPACLDDLAEAVCLAPDESRYRYHQALALQRRGELERAVEIYRALLDRTPPFARAAFPLAVALVAGRRQPSKEAVWHFLSPDERARVTSVHALLKNRPKTVRQHAACGGADALWAGLAALQTADSTAEALMQAALDDPGLPAAAGSVVHHYMGVLAWRRQEHAAALTHWQAAGAAGLHTAWLSNNLANACKQAALAYLEAPRIASPPMTSLDSASDRQPVQALLTEVLRLAEMGLIYAPEDPDLGQIANHARGHLGYQAARAGNWTEAAHLLWAASQAGERGRATLTNAALTAEALNRFSRAADLWQIVRRYRPHRPGAPKALTKHEVARLWQRTADCFERAGDYDEAARAYRNAIRNNPTDLALQLGVAQVLVKDERYSAALSVIDQLLAMYPNHVAALALQAQAFEKGRYLYAALQAWQRVLDLDPEHPTVRQNLARLNRIEGDYQRDSGDMRRATIAYRDGLKYAPADARLRTALALTSGLQGKMEAARAEIEALLRERPVDSEVHYWALHAYLRLGEWDAAGTLLAHIQSLQPPLSGEDYLQLAHLCLSRDRSSWAKQLLDLADAHTHDAGTLMQLAGLFKDTGQDARAVAVLHRVLELQPDNAEAHVLLGLYLLGDGDDSAEAEEHFLQAEQLARRTGDSAILLQARLGKNLIRTEGAA